MKMLKKILIGIALLFFVVLAIGFILPSEYRVERSIVIQASPERVYQQVADLKRWPEWAVWFERDPNMQVSYEGDDAVVGQLSRWQSETQGNGEMQLTLLDPPKRVIYQLRFVDYGIESTGEIIISPEGEGSRVVWADYGDVGSNPVNHYFAAMMDSMIGPDLQEGLEKLKVTLESQ